jgi:diguanylate cyclase (GGDEF)-like protein
MFARLKKLFSIDIDSAELENARTIPAFAGKTVFLAIILSIFVSISVLLMASVFDFLPVTFSLAIAYGIAMSWLVGGSVALFISFCAWRLIRKLYHSRDEFERLSRTDALSGLLNRRAFNEAFESVQDNASLAIFDLDRFKAINDCHGHSAGDIVIRTVANTLADSFSSLHPVARLGGEEFSVIIKGGQQGDRMALVELARRKIEALTLNFETDVVSTTVSVGVAEIVPGRRKDDIFISADRALYLAKASGRNRALHENDMHGVQQEYRSGITLLKGSAVRDVKQGQARAS